MRCIPQADRTARTMDLPGTCWDERSSIVVNKEDVLSRGRWVTRSSSFTWPMIMVGWSKYCMTMRIQGCKISYPSYTWREDEIFMIYILLFYKDEARLFIMTMNYDQN